MERAAQENIGGVVGIDNLFLVAPETDFYNFLVEIDNLVKFSPEILTSIERDLDHHAKKKKKLRREDREFHNRNTPEFLEFQLDSKNTKVEDLELATGRPRMPKYWVYVFMMIRGYKGSISSNKAFTFMKESMSLHIFLQRFGYSLPGRTTILENINAVSCSTRELIHDCQIRKIKSDGLDDFQRLLIDSTSVKASSAWPTDARMILGLVSRVHHLGQ